MILTSYHRSLSPIMTMIIGYSLAQALKTPLQSVVPILMKWVLARRCIQAASRRSAMINATSTSSNTSSPLLSTDRAYTIRNIARQATRSFVSEINHSKHTLKYQFATILLRIFTQPSKMSLILGHHSIPKSLPVPWSTQHFVNISFLIDTVCHISLRLAKSSIHGSWFRVVKHYNNHGKCLDALRIHYSE